MERNNTKVRKNKPIFYDSLSRWGTTLDEPNRKRVDTIIDKIPKGVSSVLDIGCGDGTVSNSLVDRGYNLTGIDISIVALQYFKGKSAVANIDELPFKNDSFDLVICSEVLEHLPQESLEKATDEIERVTHDNIIITTPNKEHLPAGFVKCETCRHIFHMNLHVQSFNQFSHSKLFGHFNVIETIGIDRWKHNPFITSIKHKCFNYYMYKEGLTCPSCGSKEIKKSYLLFILKCVLKGTELMSNIFFKSKPRWILSTYQAIQKKNHTITQNKKQ